jgi:hypothetical protein
MSLLRAGRPQASRRRRCRRGGADGESQQTTPRQRLRDRSEGEPRTLDVDKSRTAFGEPLVDTALLQE